MQYIRYSKNTWLHLSKFRINSLPRTLDFALYQWLRLCPLCVSPDSSVPVEDVEVLLLDELGDDDVPDGQEGEDDEREDHLEVGPGREAEHAQHQQLDHLAQRELVDLALRHPADVVVRRVRRLLSEQQQDALEHLQRGKERRRENQNVDRGEEAKWSIFSEMVPS